MHEGNRAGVCSGDRRAESGTGPEKAGMVHLGSRSTGAGFKEKDLWPRMNLTIQCAYPSGGSPIISRTTQWQNGFKYATQPANSPGEKEIIGITVDLNY